METNITELDVNGVKYIRKDSVTSNVIAEKLNDMPFVIIRTYSAGVHFGYLKSQNGKEIELVNSRRAWYWSGAFTLSQMAVDGVSKPEQCKFSCEVPLLKLTEAIEVIHCTQKAKDNLQSVKVWKA